MQPDKPVMLTGKNSSLSKSTIAEAIEAIENCDFETSDGAVYPGY